MNVKHLSLIFPFDECETSQLDLSVSINAELPASRMLLLKLSEPCGIMLKICDIMLEP